MAQQISVDVCVVCALPEEVKAVFDVVAKFAPLEEHYSSIVGDYRLAHIVNNKGEKLTLHISWLPRYGSQEMVFHATRLLGEVQPRMVIMTGICAGDRHKVKLGDLIVAERTFTYDEGKFAVDEAGNTYHQHDARTYQLEERLLQFLQFFDAWRPKVEDLEQPVSLAHRKITCHIETMASGSAVRADNPFREIQVPVRGTCAIDMEGASLARVMNSYAHIRWLVVKGVCDYADREKDDTYHEFAAQASAAYALSLIQTYVTDERLPRFEKRSMQQPSSVARTNPSPQASQKPLKLFYSYVEEDKVFLKELETHLRLLQRRKLIEPWHKQMMEGGQENANEMLARINEADIILLLLSADFIASEAYDTELAQAMDRHKAGLARVIPIILRPVADWRHEDFGRLTPLPRDGKPINQWRNRDEAWTHVAEGIRQVCEKFQTTR